jgi:hypothetical protein
MAPSGDFLHNQFLPIQVFLIKLFPYKQARLLRFLESATHTALLAFFFYCPPAPNATLPRRPSLCLPFVPQSSQDTGGLEGRIWARWCGLFGLQLRVWRLVPPLTQQRFVKLLRWW